MKLLCALGFLSAAMLSPALAGGLVPGSDHFIKAHADADANGVALGVHVPVVTSSVVETRSYGGADERLGRNYAREEPARRLFEQRPGGPAARVAVSRPWVGTNTVSDPG